MINGAEEEKKRSKYMYDERMLHVHNDYFTFKV